jgi:hypothetical protein
MFRLLEAAVQLGFGAQVTQRLAYRAREQVATADKAVVIERVMVTQSPSTAAGAATATSLVVFSLGAVRLLFLAYNITA